MQRDKSMMSNKESDSIWLSWYSLGSSKFDVFCVRAAPCMSHTKRYSSTTVYIHTSIYTLSLKIRRVSLRFRLRVVLVLYLSLGVEYWESTKTNPQIANHNSIVVELIPIKGSCMLKGSLYGTYPSTPPIKNIHTLGVLVVCRVLYVEYIRVSVPTYVTGLPIYHAVSSKLVPYALWCTYD